MDRLAGVGWEEGGQLLLPCKTDWGPRLAFWSPFTPPLLALCCFFLLSPPLCPLFFSHLALISTSAKKILPLSFCLFISLPNLLSS